jgi:hypothetical protein
MASAAVRVDRERNGQRAASRRIVRIDGRMRPLGAMGGGGRVHNISTLGFMIESDEMFDIGSYVWLSLPDQPRLSARIIWRDSFRYGCVFTTPVTAELVALLVEASNPN